MSIIERYIAFYDKETGEFINMISIEDDLAFLKTVFPRSEEDPLMYGVYRIKEKEAELLEERFGIKIDTVLYSCALECQG